MAMNEGVRRAAKAEVLKQNLTQKSLAERVGMSQPAVGRILNGERKGDPDSWQLILDALGLELVAVPKGAERSAVSPVNEPGEPPPTPAKAPKRKRKAAEEVELPPEVEELHRRWELSEFKTKEVVVPGATGGIWYPPVGHQELGGLFGELKNKYKTRRQAALTTLSDIAKFLIEEEGR